MTKTERIYIVVVIVGIVLFLAISDGGVLCSPLFGECS